MADPALLAALKDLRPPTKHPPYYYVLESGVGQNQDWQLQFMARAVIVDNITSQWIYVPDSGRFVAPYTTGKVLPLPGTQVAKVRWQNPPGIVPLITLPGQNVQLTYTDETLGPSDGSHLAYGQQTQIGGGAGANGQFTPAQSPLSIKLPNGTRALTVVLVGAITGGSLSITGDQSGATYFRGANINFQIGELITLPIVYSIDSSVTVSWAGGNINLAAIVDTSAVISMATAPLPWQAAGNLTSTAATVNLGAGGTQTIITAQANIVVYLFSMTLYTSDAGGATAGFQDTSGGVIGFGALGSAGKVFDQNYYGAPLRAGVGVQIKNFGGAASNLAWAVAYSQA